MTRLPVEMLGPRQGWAEDPADPCYNHPVRHPHGFAADRMARGDHLYDVVVVTDHNRAPTIAHAGSAIFLHLWRRPRAPTAGCIAFARRDLLWILRHWRADSRLIVRERGGLG